MFFDMQAARGGNSCKERKKKSKTMAGRVTLFQTQLPFSMPLQYSSNHSRVVSGRLGITSSCQ
jgi:hypothetical protein